MADVKPNGPLAQVSLDLGIEPGVLVVLQPRQHQSQQFPQELALGFRNDAGRRENSWNWAIVLASSSAVKRSNWVG